MLRCRKNLWKTGSAFALYLF